jgi:hypothetical protein
MKDITFACSYEIPNTYEYSMITSENEMEVVFIGTFSINIENSNLIYKLVIEIFDDKLLAEIPKTLDFGNNILFQKESESKIYLTAYVKANNNETIDGKNNLLFLSQKNILNHFTNAFGSLAKIVEKIEIEV